MFDITESFSLDALLIAALGYIFAYILARFLGNYGKDSNTRYIIIAFLGVAIGFFIDYYMPNNYDIGRIIGLAMVVYACYSLLDKYLHFAHPSQNQPFYRDPALSF